MEHIIESLRQSSATSQALGITVGGLVGVFATLSAFFLIIFLSVKLGKKS